MINGAGLDKAPADEGFQQFARRVSLPGEHRIGADVSPSSQERVRSLPDAATERVETEVTAFRFGTQTSRLIRSVYF